MGGKGEQRKREQKKFPNLVRERGNEGREEHKHKHRHKHRHKHKHKR